MALPTSIFVHTNDRAKPIALTGVTDWKYCKWLKPAGTYRNGEKWTPGTASVYATTTARSNETTFPAMPTADAAITTNVDVAPVKSDEMRDIPPRQKWEIVSGLVVAVNNAVIPAPAILPDEAYGRSLTRGLNTVTSVTAATNSIDTGITTWRIGDKLRISATTLPGGISADVIYEILSVSGGTNITLQDPASGGILDISSAGTSVQIQLVTPAPRVLPSSISLSLANGTDLVTMATVANYFVKGDIIRLTGTLPAALSSAATYRVRITTSPTVFQFENPTTGDVVTFATDGSGVVGHLVSPASPAQDSEALLLDGISGLIRFPDSLSPKISTVQ